MRILTIDFFSDLESTCFDKPAIANMEARYNSRLSFREQMHLSFALAYAHAKMGAHQMAVYYFDHAFALADKFTSLPRLVLSFYLDSVLAVIAQTDDPSISANCREWLEKFDFSDPDLLYQLGSTYHALKEYNVSVELLQQQLKLFPGDPMVYPLLMETLSHPLQDPSAAINIFKNAPASIQAIPRLQLLAGRNYEYLGEYANAEALYMLAASGNSSVKCKAINSLASLYIKHLVDPTAARSWFNKVIDERGSNFDLLQVKISYFCFLIKQGEKHIALSLLLAMDNQLENGYRYLPPDILRELAWNFYELGTRFDMVRKLAQRSIELEPGLGNSCNLLLAVLETR